MADLEQLPIPPEVYSSEHKAEMARLWIADDQQVVVLSPHMWEDPGAWGLMLVDLARHVAEAYRIRGHRPSDPLAKIRAAMEAEWHHPTT